MLGETCEFISCSLDARQRLADSLWSPVAGLIHAEPPGVLDVVNNHLRSQQSSDVIDWTTFLKKSFQEWKLLLESSSLQPERQTDRNKVPLKDTDAGIMADVSRLSCF